MMACNDYTVEGVYDLREALYLMSQNPPFKFVGIENEQIVKNTMPRFRIIMQGEGIGAARLRYIQGDYGPIDFTNIKILASEIDSYIKSQGDYCI
jgi:hypothetical protein